MKRTDPERMLQSAFSKMTPEKIDTILSGCSERKGETFMKKTLQEPEPARVVRPSRFAYAAAGAFALLLVLGGTLIGITTLRQSGRAAGNTIPSADDVVPTAEPILVSPADSARDTALSDANVLETEAENLTVEQDREDGRDVIDVEFTANGTEYDYEIDAETGEILKKETEASDVPEKSGSVDAEQAKAIALADAGAAEADVQNLTVKPDTEDGKRVFEIEFFVNGTKYDYEIDAGTGEILQRESEKKTVKTTEKPAESAGQNDPGEPIGAAKAKSIALAHAGVSAADAKELKAELDREDGRLIYEVDFKANGSEYDYEIDAYTGKILRHEKEKDD